MFKVKFFISITIFSILLFGTSVIKNQTRVIEKKIYYIKKEINFKVKDLNESQLDYSYLTSPFVIEQKINHLDKNYYVPMEYSKIFLTISDFLDLQRKFATQENENEKKIKKK